MTRSLLAGTLALVLGSSGCGAPPPRPLWRAGALRAGYEGAARQAPRRADQVEVFARGSFGLGAPLERSRTYVCGTTTVLSKAFLLSEVKAPQPKQGEPERSYSVLAALTTEEFPRDEEQSDLLGEHFSSVFGVGEDVFDLFRVTLDPAWLEPALGRLRELAARLGADAVVGVYASGAAEHHMWQGPALSFNTVSTRSPLYVNGKLLEFRLRDVRLHGFAVRYE